MSLKTFWILQASSADAENEIQIAKGQRNSKGNTWKEFNSRVRVKKKNDRKCCCEKMLCLFLLT